VVGGRSVVRWSVIGKVRLRIEKKGVGAVRVRKKAGAGSGPP
jgi:hypothetical protein